MVWLLSPAGIRHSAAVLSVAIVAFLTWWTIDFRSEEALIYARYARNFADGAGLVFNAGESRNATTSYLFAWVLVPFALGGANLPVVANMLGGLAIAATSLLLIYRLLPLQEGVAAAFGALAGVAYAVLALNFVVLGGEVPLALFLATGGVCAFRENRVFLGGVLCGLAAATRPDLVPLAVILVLALALRDRRAAREGAVGFLVAFVPFVVFSALYYGELLPSAMRSHIDLGRSGLFGTSPVFPNGANGVLNRYGPGTGILITLSAISAAVLVLAGIDRRLPSRRTGEGLDPLVRTAWSVLFFAVASVLILSVVQMPAFNWYVAPLAWAVIVLIALTAPIGARLASAANPRSRLFAGAFAIAALTALALASAARLENVSRTPDRPLRALSRWLDANGGEGCTVGAPGAGYISWYSSCRVVDELGTTTGGNSAAIRKGDYGHWLERAHPRFLVAFSPAAPYEEGVREAVVRGEYRSVEGVVFPGRLLFQETGRARGDPDWLLGGIGQGDPRLNENVFAVRGVFKPALFMHVSQSHDFALQLNGARNLETFIGIADGAERSDGVTFIVRAEGRELDRKVIRPGPWQSWTVPLPEPSGGTLRLTFETDVAPGGTSNFGWAVWGEPHFVARP